MTSFETVMEVGMWKVEEIKMIESRFVTLPKVSERAQNGSSKRSTSSWKAALFKQFP